MIARCPGCQTRYRVAPEKIGPQGARIRCSKCANVFRVVAPPAAAVQPPPRPEPKVRVLVAEADPELAKSIASYLERRAIGADAVADGGAALLRLTRTRPPLAILGARLPGLRAPGIAEIAKRMTDLQEVPLIRIAPADEPATAPEFDADYTIEPGDVPDALGPLLEQLGVGESPGAAAPPPKAPAPQRAPAPQPAPAARRPAAAPAAAAPKADASAEVAAAERLARIIVSDIILYNEAKFAQGVADGDVGGALQGELEEAGALFRQRVSESLRSGRDFLVEELERRAQKRRGS